MPKPEMSFVTFCSLGTVRDDQKQVDSGINRLRCNHGFVFQQNKFYYCQRRRLNGHRMLFMYVISGLICHVMSHGQMVDPPARPYLAKAYPNGGFVEWDDFHSFNCGGRGHLHGVCGGTCGVCGDRCDDPNAPNEAGGIYATGFISRTYQEGQIVNITVLLTANHWGYFEFRICPNNDVTKKVTHACLDQHVLQLADGSGTRFHLPPNRVGNYIVPVRLPAGMTCTQCVIQWRMHNGNDWNIDPQTHRGCLGCGPQEEFYGCADVAIQSTTTSQLYHLFGKR